MTSSDRVAPGDLVGQTVSNYQIVRLIGQGGMGVVYAARHLFLDRKVAIKVLREDLVRDEVMVQRFLNEARAATRIHHPNIISVLDAAVAAGGPYLVMEFLEGESLGTRLRRDHRLPVAAALDVVRQTGSALAAAHAKGIIHRDLKPENLFLVPRPGGGDLVKVLDFGIAKLREDPAGRSLNTLPGALIGTPRYMSPEQCLSLTVDQRADVYALGVILYEILCGEPPFMADEMIDLLVLHATKEPRPPGELLPDIPPFVAAAIGKALAKAPEARFESMAAFVEALAAPPVAPPVVAPTVVVVAPPIRGVAPRRAEPRPQHRTPPEPEPPPPPPGPRVSRVLAALAALGAVLLILGAVLSGDQPAEEVSSRFMELPGFALSSADGPPATDSGSDAGDDTRGER